MGLTTTARSRIAPCLRFAGEAAEAAAFYVPLFPGSRVERVQRNAADGTVLLVEFALAGQRFIALNGGVRPERTDAVSFHIDCADQAEVDLLWDALLAGGGQLARCGRLKDRYGVSWQVVPSALPEVPVDLDPAKAARVMEALLGMVKLDVAALRAAFEGQPSA